MRSTPGIVWMHGPDRVDRTSGLDRDRALPPQVGKLVVERDPAPRDDDHPPANGLDLRQDVRREQDRMPLAQLADQVADLADLDRVEPGRRLVEDQDLRVVHHRLGQADPLAESPRKLADDALLDLAELASAHDLGDRPPPLALAVRP